jgi:hypothetical protein
MSTVVDFYLRTPQAAATLADTYREHLRAKGVDPARYYIHFRPANSEDREGSLTEFGLEPTVVASVQPPRGQGDAELEAAALATAHAVGAEMVAFHDGTPMLSYRGGVAHLSPEDREYYEEHVLPGFEGRVEWGEILPWMS